MAAENINRKLNIYINDKEVVNSLAGVTRGMNALRGKMNNLNRDSEDYQDQLDKLSKEEYLVNKPEFDTWHSRFHSLVSTIEETQNFPKFFSRFYFNQKWFSLRY